MAAEIGTIKLDLWAVPSGTEMPSSGRKVGTVEIPVHATRSGSHLDLSADTTSNEVR